MPRRFFARRSLAKSVSYVSISKALRQRQEHRSGALASIYHLGGHFKTGNLWTVKTGNYLRPAKTGEFYFVPSSVRKSVWTLVRQLRGPHLSTCA